MAKKYRPHRWDRAALEAEMLAIKGDEKGAMHGQLAKNWFSCSVEVLDTPPLK